MITVAQIVPEMHGGGVEQGTLEVARHLVASGHRAIVISAGGRMVESLTESGATHITLPVGRKSPRTIALAPKLRRILRSESVDVVHARSRVPAWLCVLALGRRKTGHPAFLTSVHGLYSVNRYSRVMTRGDLIECVSETARRYVCDNYPSTDQQKLVVIPRGVDTEVYHPGFRASSDWEVRFRESLGLPSDPLVILPGRLTRLKGHHDFIEVMQRLESSGVRATGLIVGGEDPRRPGYAAELREAVANSPNVVITGHRKDLREILSISAAAVSPSTHPESFGRTVLEALSLGIPVAGYDHGGVGEVLSELFPYGRVSIGDIRGMTEVTGRLVRGEADPIRQNTRFTLGEMLSKTLELYLRVGSGR